MRSGRALTPSQGGDAAADWGSPDLRASISTSVKSISAEGQRPYAGTLASFNPHPSGHAGGVASTNAAAAAVAREEAPSLQPLISSLLSPPPHSSSPAVWRPIIHSSPLDRLYQGDLEKKIYSSQLVAMHLMDVAIHVM